MALFTSQTAAAAARKSHAKGNTRQPSRRKQVSAIQNVLHDCVMTLQQDLHACEEVDTRTRIAVAIASSAKGWQSANAQERQLKGEPNVKPVDAPKPESSKPKSAIPL